MQFEHRGHLVDYKILDRWGKFQNICLHNNGKRKEMFMDITREIYKKCGMVLRIIYA